jgi:hypothetical protein
MRRRVRVKIAAGGSPVSQELTGVRVKRGKKHVRDRVARQ